MVPWVTPIGATNYQISKEIEDSSECEQNLNILMVIIYLRLCPKNFPGNGEPH
jgi:hypothetical protein